MQKNGTQEHARGVYVFLKCLIIMKLLSILLFVSAMQVSARGYSQKFIDINLKNTNLKTALSHIQKNSSYRFIYNDELLTGTHPISRIHIRKGTIQQVMSVLLKATSITYHMMDNDLIVLSRLEPQTLDIEIKGVVRLQDNRGILTYQAGISVLEKGTQNGTVTASDGSFSLRVTDPNTTLEISLVGYNTVTYPLEGKTAIEVLLTPSADELQNVVVTALGLTRQKKSLTYATQNLNGDELSDSRQSNLTSAMNGKVAGLTINKTNAGPGASNRIVFRGNRSINGNNQPLIVVDGVRIDNSAKASADVALFGGRDNGDGISNINPDDVESVSILTGASAAALYGSDAANGVVMITTKKGRAGKGLDVQLSGSYTLENPLFYPNFQNTYGQGTDGIFGIDSDFSWGPRMDGQSITDWTGKTQPYNAQPNNVKDFFNTGSELVNTISVAAGNERSQTYFSYSNNLSKGIVPNNAYKRHNINLRQTTRLSDKLSLDVKANYIVEGIENRPLSGAANRVMSTLYVLPRSIRLDDISDFEAYNDGGDLLQRYWAMRTTNFQNPYWSVYRNLYSRDRNRFIGLAALTWKITPALNLLVRSSLDYYTDKSEEKNYNNTYWIDFPGNGNYILNKESNRQFNNEVILTYNKNLSNDLSLNATLGASLEQFSFERSTLNNQGLRVPNLFSSSNAVALTFVENRYFPFSPIRRWEKQSVFGAAQLSFKNYLFLDVTARNDWNSTLPVHNASYFFPSAGISAIISEMVAMPNWVNYLKLRTSYAYVGNGAGFNQLKPAHSIGPGGNNGFLVYDRVLRNAELKPEQTRSYEAGVDFGLLNNRLSGNVTFYNTYTINQTLRIPVPDPSGYAARFINAGKIRNKGWEVLLTGRPVDTRHFKWNIAFNFGTNRNYVIYLDDLQPRTPLSSPQAMGSIVVEEGKRYGELYTSSLRRDDQGRIIVNQNGIPLLNTQQNHYVGNFNPDWTAGIINSFRYKNWALSFQIDQRKGGVVISGTQAKMAEKGVADYTAEHRETGFVIPNSVLEDGTHNSITISPQAYWVFLGSNSVGEMFTYDATNIRLREASLTYMLPDAVFNNQTFIKNASVSVIGRNLFFLKNNARYFDPESSLGTGNNQGIEYSSIPTTRSVGLHLKVNF
ncbi:MAG: SusC/RagA family TonB-linked outer membrane protein [Chitinophagaceae bacterium]|nr:SusC/RagA family TonB-linked outer membrane protein [Chitinophagaceae bacterium]MCW5928879.1 SusC/RagA family TonB-linked outer membrane protein [Chitinophagaceae bacterium]